MDANQDSQLIEEIERHKDNIYVLHMALKTPIAQHTHPQGHILVVSDGVATMDVEHSRFYIPTGHFVWIPKGKSHRISVEDKAIDMLCIYLPEKFTYSPFYEQVGIYPMFSLLFHSIECVRNSSRAYTPQDWQYELLTTINHILPNLIDERRAQLWLPTTDNPTVNRIVDTIHRRYSSPITEQDIALEVGISVRTLSRYLKTELHTSFLKYLRKYRVMMAIKKMVRKEESITNIAYSVGYESLTVFSNAFFTVTGIRPTQFFK